MFVRFHRDITDAKIDTLGTITSICSISLGPSTETKISNVLQTSNYNSGKAQREKRTAARKQGKR